MGPGLHTKTYDTDSVVVHYHDHQSIWVHSHQIIVSNKFWVKNEATADEEAKQWELKFPVVTPGMEPAHSAPGYFVPDATMAYTHPQASANVYWYEKSEC